MESVVKEGMQENVDRTILITGAAGFIGSAVVREALSRGYGVVAVDCLTYAGSLDSIEELIDGERVIFEKANICDVDVMTGMLERHAPIGIMHLAAETHVDRSISSPHEFIQSNIEGTFQLLEVSRQYLGKNGGGDFRFHHVSTDEVYGDLADSDLEAFSETSSYQPSSPYSASKAASDHLVRAWSRTYGLPVVLSNSSNNFGPRQHPEKLIPRMIFKALAGKSLPVFGDGEQVRDWLNVEDHAAALLGVFERGKDGETYCISGDNPMSNIDVVREICRELEKVRDQTGVGHDEPFENLIAFVSDRPGHDIRYALDASKIKEELGWSPNRTFQSGLAETISWYVANQDWVAKMEAGSA